MIQAKLKMTRRGVYKTKLLLILFLLFAALAAHAQVRYAIIPENPRPGEPVTIGISERSGEGIMSAALLSGGQRLSSTIFFPIQEEDDRQSLMAAVLAVPATAKPGAALIHVENASGLVSAISLQIGERDFVSEVIELNETLTGIRTAPDPRKTAESEQLWTILNTTGSDIYCSGSFKAPVSSTRRTSFFGDRRVFKYSNGKSDTSIHAGVDYGVPRGTPVNACGQGKVVLARFRIVTGNSVIVEHLPGVYSLYYHLDTIDAREGDVVDAGTLLGRSGATGLATGPHLHWEIRVSGENTDPDAFITRPILDKEAIMVKISQ
jgi:murein DD-endopeptidase MepM/ murein hydrolase activator NlpD